MHRQTKSTAIPAKVKAAVALRDCAHGTATCILCGAPGGPYCHVVRRSQGGMGVEENIVTLCGPCHYAFDEGIGLKRLRPFGIETRQDVEDYIIRYLKGFYPDWTKERVTYRKWRSEDAESDHYHGPHGA